MAKPVARLALGKQRPLHQPERHLAALDQWARSFAGVFPDDDNRRPVAHWHLPVDQRLVDPPWAKREHQAQAAQALLIATDSVRRARPASRNHQRVYAALFWPAMFMSEFGVFLDPAYGRDFENRTSKSQCWTMLNPNTPSLAHNLGLSIPEGFVEIGYHERTEEDDPDSPGRPRIFEQEIWMIREPHFSS